MIVYFWGFNGKKPLPTFERRGNAYSLRLTASKGVSTRLNMLTNRS